MRRFSKYIYQHKEWPEFTWDTDKILPLLIKARHRQGVLKGYMAMLGFKLRSENTLYTLTQDILKSTEIEGEFLNHEQVRSSVARKLGMDIAGLIPSDRDVEGVVEMMLDATQNYDTELTKERLFGWHSSLFPSGRSGMHKITVGNWRTNEKGPMQVVSGPMGKERIHFEAPESEVLAKEMKVFLKWLQSDKETDAVLKSGIAHLWFVTIHPFDDGNGRIARTIADMQLAIADDDTQRYYSMSSQIRAERKAYYEILEKTQKGDLDITEWLTWYLNCLNRALTTTEERLQGIMAKTKFWDTHMHTDINERQRKILNKLFDGLEGKLSSSKWAKLTKCSPDTALRDIQDLINKGILEKENAGGRSTNYRLK